MNVELLISPSVPVLLPEDTGSRALELMEENNLSQLPVVTEDNYQALLQEHDILDLNNPDTLLSQSGLLNFKPAIIGFAHPFEAMRIMHEMSLSILPVIDNEHKYIGALTRDGLFNYFTEKSGIDTPGGIIVLEIAPRDYTLYEIARICENEDATILNLQVNANQKGMLEITIKLNRTGVEAVVSSFERHKYHVIEVFGEDTQDVDITGKYNLLMNYINM